MWMNEYEIETAFRRWVPLAAEFPVLAAAATTMDELVRWTNANSDGWPYWRKPALAAKKLMALITSVDRFRPVDIDLADYKKALTPIKSFRTKHNADFTIAAPKEGNTWELI
jgi:hypothetical protein